MAQIDASIPLQVQQVQLPSAAQVMTLRELAMRSRMGEMEMAAAKRKQQADQELRTVLGDANSRDAKGNLRPEALQRVDAIDPQTGMALRKDMALAAQREAQTKAALAKLDSTQLDIYSKKTDMVHGGATAAMKAYDEAIAKGVPEPEARRQGQAAYNEQLEQLQRSGVFSEEEIRGLPTSFDPQKTKASLASVLKAKDYFAEETARRKEAEKAPTMRTRVEGTTEVQEEWAPTSKTWKKVGSGPRFKPEEDGGKKPPAGYQWNKDRTALEPIPGGPATRKPNPTTVAEKMNPTMLASVKLDIKELDSALQGIDALKTKTGSLFFDENEQSKNALVRMFKRNLTPDQQQQYDTIANRIAMAIASVQSMGRGQISDAKIREAQKLVPVPGDSAGNIEQKLKRIRLIQKQAEEVLDTPLKSGGQSAGEQIDESLQFFEK